MSSEKDLLNSSANGIIFAFEENYNPYRYRIEGFCLWPIVRFGTYKNLASNLYDYDSRTISTVKKSKILKHILESLPKEIWKILKLRKKKKKIVIITFYQVLRDKSGDQYLNIYFDYFKDLPRKSIYWYNAINGDKLERYHADYIDGYIRVLAHLYGKHRSRFYRNQINNLFSDFKKCLIENHKKEYFTLDLKKWHGLVCSFLSSMLIFSLFIKIIKPKVILIENGYGQEGFIAAAKKCKIPVFEIQHGGISGGHMGYAYTTVASKFKQAMPIPDKILTFGKYFSQVLREGGYWNPQDLPPIGFPRLEHFRSHKTKQKKRDSQPIRITVLISSQWAVVDKIVAFVKPVIESIDRNVSIIVKPHPLESIDQTNRYKDLGNRVRILTKKMELYQALALCDIHCAVYSTTLFESIALGIPTMILNVTGHEAVYPLIEHGCAKFISSPDDFCNALNKAANEGIYYSNWERATLRNRDFFFEREPDEKLEYLLSNLL